MTTEELLRPRYKIIAPIPFKEEEDFWRVGEILDRDWGWHGDDDDGFKYHISDYPHLFKKLEWWEERKIEEMPQFLRYESGKVVKVRKWEGNFCRIEGHPYAIDMNFFLPSTATEYEQYINQKQNDGQ